MLHSMHKDSLPECRAVPQTALFPCDLPRSTPFINDDAGVTSGELWSVTGTFCSILLAGRRPDRPTRPHRSKRRQRRARCPRSDPRPVTHLPPSPPPVPLTPPRGFIAATMKRQESTKSLETPNLGQNFARTLTRAEMGRSFLRRQRPHDSSGNGCATPAAAATTRLGSVVTARTASVFTVAKAGCGTAYYGMPDAMPLDVVGGIPGRHTAGHRSIAALSDNGKQDCSDSW